MRVIDLHAHVTPQRFQAAIRSTGVWHGLTSEAGELEIPGFRLTPGERLAEMDALGVDVQVVSPNAGFYQYDKDLAITKAIARECNDEIAEMTVQHPGRFAGLATVPMQNVSAAITEMERAMLDLRLKGIMINDHVNGRTYDEPEFLPFWARAESLGAIVFFHQGNDTVVNHRIARYHLDNAVGNLTERVLTFGALVYGGVLDKYPKLKLLLGHAGGYAPFGVARMDRVWEAARELAAGGIDPAMALGRFNDPKSSANLPQYGPEGRIPKPPSSYLPGFYYDCCTYTGQTLRFLIDTVGIDRVVFGTDYPAPMMIKDAVNWLDGLECLGQDEKEAILSRNPAQLLRM